MTIAQTCCKSVQVFDLGPATYANAKSRYPVPSSVDVSRAREKARVADNSSEIASKLTKHAIRATLAACTVVELPILGMPVIVFVTCSILNTAQNDALYCKNPSVGSCAAEAGEQNWLR
jgi:hypothetical protein